MRSRNCCRDTIVLVTTPDQFTGAGAAAFERLKRACKGVYYGGDCYNYALIASGHVDLVVEMGLKTVDFAALDQPDRRSRRPVAT